MCSTASRPNPAFFDIDLFEFKIVLNDYLQQSKHS
jgi:hypothetical protein